MNNIVPRPSNNRQDLLIRVASMYYERDYSQQKIASVLKISRSNVSRLLKEAKDKGIVEIKVKMGYPAATQLEAALVSEFGIKAALVLDSGNADYAQRLAITGRLAALHLEHQILEQDTIAIAWGTSVSAAVQAFPEVPLLQVDVAQMLGSVGRVASVTDGPELARELATKLGGEHYYLPAPLFVDSPETRHIFLQQTSVVDTFDVVRNARLALVGIGTTAPASSSFLRAGHLTEDEIEALRLQGAVGETCGQHFDIDGNARGFDINQRVVSLDPDEIRALPYKIAIACGLDKRLSIIGALRGGYVDVLATDDITAQAIVDYVRNPLPL